MKMKSIFNKKILIAIATISSLSLQSCLDDDDNYAMRFPNALVTVKTDADQTVFLQLDDKTTLLPTNIRKPVRRDRCRCSRTCRGRYCSIPHFPENVLR